MACAASAVVSPNSDAKEEDDEEECFPSRVVLLVGSLFNLF